MESQRKAKVGELVVPPLPSSSSSSSGLPIRRGAASPTQVSDIQDALKGTSKDTSQGSQVPPPSTTKGTTTKNNKAKSGGGDTNKLNAKAQDPVDLVGGSNDEEEGSGLTARVKGFAAISNLADFRDGPIFEKSVFSVR